METQPANGTIKPKDEIRVRKPCKAIHEHLIRIAKEEQMTVAKLVKQHLPDIIKLYPQVK